MMTACSAVFLILGYLANTQWAIASEDTVFKDAN